MNHPLRSGLFALLPFLALGTALAAGPAAERHWPQWRGPRGDGVAPHGDPPTTWSERANVRYKVAIPGRGHASPVVWGDRIYLLTAVDAEPRGRRGRRHAGNTGGAAGPRARRGPRPRAALRRPGARPRHRQDRLGAHGPQGAPARGHPHRRLLGGGLGAHRRRADLGLLRLARHLLPARSDGEALWQRDLGDMQTQATASARAPPRPSPATRWWSTGTTRARASSSPSTPDRRRALAGGARRAHLVVDAARRRGGRPAAGGGQRHRQGARLRPRHRQGGLGGGRDDGQRHPHARLGRRPAVRHQRLPRQRAQGDPARPARAAT